MEDKDIWLIHHKASLGMRSTMNIDGSSYILAVDVVPASGVLEAIPQLKGYLNSDHMDIWKCARYDPDQFAEENEEHCHTFFLFNKISCGGTNTPCKGRAVVIGIWASEMTSNVRALKRVR